MPARKRSAEEFELASVTPRRSSRRSSTLVKSSYFESDNENEEDELPPKKRGRPSKKQAVRKVDESEEEKYDDDDDDDEDDDDDVEEEELPPKQKPRGRPLKGKPKDMSDEEQYKEDPEDDGEDDNEEEDDEDDDDGIRKVTILPLEKLRDEGGIPYEDHKVHKNTMLFLRDLKANNKRPWLKSHDGEYRRALKDWQTFVEKVTDTLMQVDETIPELPPKDVIFRIHRDIRFSKDPTPYKPHFSAAWSRTGRKGPYAVYYIHCEPKASFIGGGLWHPEAGHIARLRRSIDQRPQRWRRAMSDPLFKRIFFPGVKESAGTEAVVNAFVGRNQENALKKRPMGYDITHRDIELLKLRNFTVGAKIDDDILCNTEAQEKIEEIMRGLSGFVTFLNSVVMPEPHFVDQDSDDGDDAEDGSAVNGDAEEEEEETNDEE